jgi:integrase
MKTKNQSYGSLVKRGGNYYAYWRQGGKAFCRVLKDENGRSITTEPEAQKVKGRLMEIIVRQSEIDSLQSIADKLNHKKVELAALMDAQNPPLALAAAWTAFVRSPERNDCAASTLGQYEICWGKFVEWIQANRPKMTALRDVDQATASEYLQSLNHGKLAPATFNHHLRTLRYVTKTITDEARLSKNVWLKFKYKKDVGFSRRQLTVEELKRVIGTATGEMKMLFTIGLYTGMRLGDCCTIKWSEVDLHRGQIRRVPNKIARLGQKAAITIPIDGVLADMLAQVPEDKRTGYVLPWHAGTYTGKNGNSRPQITQAIQKHFESCGITTLAKREVGRRSVVLVGFHSMRHTFVSICRGANVPLAVVEYLVGHHSTALTQHYTHVSEDASRSAVAMLPAIDVS